MAGAGPLGQEAAFLVAIDEAFLHLDVHLGINEVQEGEEATEGIPKTGVGEIATWKDFTCVGAVVDRFAVCSVLEERAGEEDTAIEAGIEGAEVIDVRILNFDAAQHVIPALAASGTYLIEGTCSQLAQIQLSLLKANERGSNAQRDLLASPERGEAHDSLGVVCLQFDASLLQLIAIGGGDERDGMRELDDEVVLEVLRHTAGVLRRVAEYTAMVLIDKDV
jgi:hypothetical protein